MKRLLGGAAALLVLGVLTLVGVAACASLDKAELEARLLELPKNARFGELGVQDRPVTVALEASRVEGRLRVVHVPAASPGSAAESTPLVLVHGTPGSLFDWSELLFGEGRLAGWRDTWVLDVLGHGITPELPGSTSFQRCADWIAACLRELGLGPVDLVGHSYGGEFAWRVALDHPELVRRLVLIDSAGMPRAEDEWLPEEEAMRDLPGAGLGYLLNARDRVETALQPHFREPVETDRLEEMFLICEDADNWGAMVELARDENGERAPELTGLTVPTLLLWGEDDIAYTVPRFARRFEQAIPAARLELIPEAGHYPHAERPAEVAALLREFLAD